MSKSTNLYIAIFPIHNIIKIGKADNIHQRLQSLSCHWGYVDYENSYWASVPKNIIFRLEKTLHLLLSDYKVKSEIKDGYTEIFSADALKKVLEHIEYFVNSNAISIELKQGINKPVLPFKNHQCSWRYLKLKKKSNDMFSYMKKTIENFESINRLILILLHKKNKILYQYDIIDNFIYFRFSNFSKYHEKNATNICLLFSFGYKDYFRWGGTNLCEMVGQDNIFQYKIRLLSNDSDKFISPLLSDLLLQAEYLLKQLPKRSSRLAQDIPILEHSKILQDISDSLHEQNL